MSTYRSKHKHSLLVEVLGEIEFRQGATMKHRCVRYRRLDRDEGETARTVEEFVAKFEKVEDKE